MNGNRFNRRELMVIDAVNGSHSSVTEPSAPQRRLWLIHEIDPAHPAYHICLPLVLHGPLDPHSLSQAIAVIERRQPALRAQFTVDGGRLTVRYSPPGTARPHLIDTRPEDLDDLLDRLARRPFDLAAGPVARWTLLRTGPRSHILVLAVHHLVFDGGSLPILSEQLQGVTLAIRGGGPTPASAEHKPGDARMWTANGLAYWRERLKDPPPPLSIWLGEARDPRIGPPSATVCVRLIERHLVDRVRRHGRDHLATPFMIFLAALLATLHRYTGRDDIVVGSPVSLRETESELSSIGLMLNLIPLRLRPDSATTFAGLVRDCRDAVLEAIDHRTVPFEVIVDAVRPERSASVTPLFQVLFAYQKAPNAPQLPDVSSTILASPTPAAKYCLSVTVTETGDRIELAFEADAILCADVELSRFADYLTTMLAAAMEDPDRPIGRLALLPASKMEDPQPASRSTGRAGSAGLAALVERAAHRWPDAVAVHAIDEQLSYAQLNGRANHLARQLVNRGIGAEQVVGVCLPRGAELMIALLAVAKAGAAFLPLDPRQPAQRLRLMLDDARAVSLIATQALAARLESPTPLLRIDPAAEAAGPGIVPDLGALAYVLYTSGSTGTPKGVGISHGNVAGFLAWTAEEFAGDDLSGTIALTSAGFDLSVFEMFAPMAAGGVVIMVDGPEWLADHPRAARATILNTVPSVLEVLMDADCLPDALRAVNLAGEPLPRDLVDRLLRRMPWVRVRNLYGPSEGTTYVTSSLLRDGSSQPPIGRAVAGAQIWLVDDDDQPVPPGVSGRLLLGGSPIARGYLHRPALTAGAFRPDGLSGQPGARLYHTGDLARLGHDGQLQFLGRADQQIKLRGVRIELEEIEVLLRQHATVRDAAVVVARQGPAESRLVAYVCPADSWHPAAEALAAHLRQRLPEVMVPSAWAVVDELPRNANGKLDRQALGRSAASVTAARPSRIPPRSAMEELVVRVWSEVLGQSDIGIYDQFFDVGGNSLQLIRLHRLLCDHTGIRLNLVDLFRLPTAAALAGHLQGLRAEGGKASTADEPATQGLARGAARRDRARLRAKRWEAGDEAQR